MSCTPALVTPELMRWAIDRSGLSETSLAEKINVNPKILQKWLTGDARPTFKQAEDFAKSTFTPFGCLFLKQIPDEPELLPDLRTLEGKGVDKPSPELRDIIQQVKSQQEWYKEYLLANEGEPLPYVGSVTLQTPIAETVQSIKRTLNFSRRKNESWDKYQGRLIQHIEDIGILVMQSGIVGSNTQRKLSVKEFRGFAIADEIAPIIFINLSDAGTARLFTLVHELAHIWLGSTGISSASALNYKKSQHKEEPYCNRVAGEFLVPDEELKIVWKKNDLVKENLPRVAKHFHVSKLVIARRALDLDFITQDYYQDFYNSEITDHKRKLKSSSGGNYYDNVTKKNSSTLSGVIVAEALSGNMLFRDAGKLLGIAPAKLRKFESHLRK